MERFECFYVVTIKFKSVSKRIPKEASVIKVYTLIKGYNEINTRGDTSNTQLAPRTNRMSVSPDFT